MSKKTGSSPSKRGAKDSAKRKRPRRTRMLALEPRMLFDGALGIDLGSKATAALAGDTSAALDTGDTAAAAIRDPSTETVQKPAAADAKIQLGDEVIDAAPGAAPYPKEIVFIDSTLWGSDQLAAAARDLVEVRMLDPQRDGVQQISEALAGRKDISAIHIVSHGAPGKLWLGSGELSTQTFDQYAEALKGWRSSLAEGADILIYGCRAGAEAAGADFARTLGELTGTDIGASTDFTGGETADANWSMEFNWGSVESQAFGDLSLLNAYEYRLATLDLAGNTGWTPILYGTRMDPGGDQQANKASTDLVGDSLHPVLYSAYNDQGTASESDDIVSYRMRVASADSQGNFGSLGIMGLDANLDGDMDIYIGIDDRQGTPMVTLFNPGTGLNIGPSSSSITPAPGRTFTATASTYRFVSVSVTSDSDWDGNTDIDAGGKADYFVSFSVSFDQIKQELARLNVAGNPSAGISIDSRSPLRYVLMTMTQNNSINGDIGGIVGGNNSGLTFDQLGAFTPIVSFSDSPPIITSGGGGTTASYVAVAGYTQVTTVTALDKDPADTLRYDIVGGADAGLFTIDATTGVISFVSAPSATAPIDADADGRYEVTVRVRDYSDVAATQFKGGADTQDLTITVVGTPDTAPPLLTAVTPADNSTSIAPNANLFLQFNEPVQAGTGVIYIRNAATGAIVQTISAADPDLVRFSGNNVTINPLNDLSANTEYYVEVTPTAFKDLAGNAFTGINDPDPLAVATSYTWNFKTGSNALADDTPPTLTATAVTSTAGATLAPADNQTGVAIGTNITLTFSEAVFPDAGFFYIRKSSDGSLAARISVSDSTQVTFNSVAKTVTLNPDADLAQNTDYYVEIDAQALQDQVGNHYSGIDQLNQGVTNAYALNFKTGVDTTQATVSHVSASNIDGTWIAGDTIFIRVKFSEAVSVTGTPTLQLETGSTDRVVSYSSGSGSDTLVFQYVVQPGDTTADLNYLATSSLSLNAGTIKDAAGNNAVLTLPALADGSSLGGQKNLVIDAAPVNLVPLAQPTDNGTPLVFSAANSNLISVTDADSGSVTVTLTATSGTLTLSGTAGLTFTLGDGTADGTMTFSGTLADVNAALNGMAFNATSGFVGAGSVQVVTRDGATSVNGVVVQDSDTFAINISGAVKPVLGNGGQSVTYTENAAPTAINPIITVSDPNSATLASATVAITGNFASGQDVLAFTNDGATMGNITASYNAGTGELTLSSVGATATTAQWQAALRAGTYSNSSEAPSTAARTVTYVVSDGTNPSTASTATVSVAAVNDAPVLADTALTLSVAEDAAVPSGAVGSLVSAYTGGITDPDGAVAKGIAVVATDEAKGTWYYSLDNGSTWNPVGSVSTAQSLLLPDTARLYFRPAADFNGTASSALTLRAWDQSTGSAGAKVSTGTTGSTTAFSSATDAINVTVTAANDAPVGSGVATLEAIAEDASAPVGASVNSLFAGNFSDASDSVSGGSTAHTLAGIAITSYMRDAAKGEWQYFSGGSWTTLSSSIASPASAFTVASADSLRFVPAANFNGAAPALTVALIDSSTSVASGATVDASTRGGTTAFSSTTVTLSHSVSAVNDAPVLGDTGLTLGATINAGAPVNGVTTGVSVSTLTGGITDVDGGAVQGIALVGSSEANGTWYYSLNGGTTWTAVGAVSGTNALLLPDTARLYFQPAANFGGTSGSALTVRAWDQTSGSAGSKVDASSTGGTTAFSSASDTVDAIVSGPNQAPTLSDTGLSITVAEDAGLPSGAVGSLLSSFAGGIADADTGALQGIAITASDEANGIWYYSTNGGGSWTAVGTVSTAQSLLLANTAGTRVYFAPGTNYNGTSSAALTIRAWDRTDGNLVGDKVSTATTGGTSAFSTAADTVDAVVTPVNDAPVLSAGGTMSVAEDAGAPSGAVGSLIGALTGSASDADAGAVVGIAVTATVETNGTWWYSRDGGTTWTKVGTVSGTSSLLLADDGNTRLYFQPNANYNATGAANALTFRAWDRTSGGAGAKVDTSTNGGSTAFSSATAGVTLAVTAANDAPTRSSSTATLASVNEDTASPSGAAVSSLFSGSFSDSTDAVSGGSSANTLAGVVVVGNSANATTQGKWQWNNAGTWTDISTSVSTTSGLVLAEGTSVRFLPNANYNGTPGTLTVRLIDNSSGSVTSGGTVDVTSSGGTSQYSSNANDVTLSTSIAAVGEAPTASGQTLPVTRNTAIVLARDAFGFADVDGDSFSSVTITSLPTTGNLRFNGTNITSGSLPYTVTIADIDSGKLSYLSGTSGSGANFQFNFTVKDSSGADSTSSTVNFAVANNARPSVAGLNNTSYTEQGAAATVNSALTVADGGNKVTSATVTITDFVSGDTLTWNTTYASTNGLSVAYNSGTGVLTVTSGNKSPTVYQTLLRSVAYSFTGSSADNPDSAGTDTTRSINFVTGDATGSGPGVTATVTITAANDAPVLGDTALAMTVAEDAGVPSGQVGALVSSFAGGITEPDGYTTRGIAVVATNETNGTWYYSTDNGSSWSTVGTVSAAQSLLLASDGNTRLYFAPAANFAGSATSALTLRAWDRTSGTAGTKVSTASTGGSTAFSSATDVIDVTVSAANDAPTLAATSVNATYTENSGTPADLFSGVTIGRGGGSDESGQNIKALQLTVSGLADGTAEKLTVDGTEINLTDGTSGTSTGGNSIAYSVSVSGGIATVTLTRTGDMSVAQAQTLVDGLGYRNTSDSPAGSSRAASLTLIQDSGGTASGGVDSTALSVTSTVTISPSNDAPTLGAGGNAVGFTENGAAITLNNAITVADLDNATLSSATVSITGNFASGQDVLAFTPSAATGNITASYSAGTGVLTLSSPDNSATVAQYQAALRLVTYSNTSDGPSTANRTVSFVVNDGTANATAATTTVTVAAQNDAPVLADRNLSVSIAEDSGVPSGAVGSLVSAFTGGITDADSGASTGIAIVAKNETSGTWYYTTNGGTSWNTLGTIDSSNSLLLASDGSSRLYFRPSADFNGTASGALTIRAWDQTSGSAGSKVSTASTGGITAFSSATDVIDAVVTTQNDAPTASGSSTLAAVTEDVSGPSGGTISSLFGASFGDTADNQVASGGSSANTLAGVAITSYTRDAAKGEWQYLNGGTWTTIGSSIASAANALTVATADSLRFVPAANFNGAVPTLTVALIDSSSSVTTGATIDASARGAATAYSSATVTLSHAVTAANDAPVAAGSATLAAIGEDAASPAGDTVSSLFTGNFSDGIDTVSGGSSANTLAGIAIVDYGRDATKGEWQYFSGGSWSTIASSITSASSALAVASADSLRFVPAANYNGPAPTLTVVLVDSSGTATTGATIDVSTRGGTTAYSSAAVTLSHTINATNDAPVASGSAVLPSDPEDTAAASVTARPVSVLFGSSFADATDQVTGGSSAHVLAGVAITTYTADAAKGTWQYSTDGSTWNTLSSVAGATSALTLKSSDQLRFVPTADYNGAAPTVTVALIDSSTTVTSGATVDASTRGGTTAFSAATVDLSHSISAVNDAPTLAPGAATITVLEDAATPSGAVGTLVSSLVGGQSDVDSGALKGIAITSLSSASGTWYYTTDGGTTWNPVTTSVSVSSSLLLASDANTRLYFKPNADFDGAVNAPLTFRAWDQTSGTNGERFDTSINGGTSAFSSATDTISVSVTAVNDAPVGTDNVVWVDKNTAYVFGTADFGFSDPDDSPADLLQAVKFTDLPDAAAGVLEWNNGTTWVAVTADQFISTADIAANKLRFTPTTDAVGLGLGNLRFRVQDTGGTAGGGVDLDTTDRSLLFNVGSRYAPTLSGGSSVPYVETLVPAPVVVNSGISVFDVDNPTLVSGQVVISRGYQAGTLANPADQLGFTSTGATGNIAASWDQANGVLTLTSAGGAATLAQWEAAFQAVTYISLDNAPATGARTVSFLVNDGTNDSNVVTSTITMQPSNDFPVVTAGGTTLAYVENQAAAAIDSGILISDPDLPSDFGGGWLRIDITANGAAEDQLSILAQSGISVAGTSVLYDGGSGAVVIGAIDATLNGASGQSLKIALNDNATPAAVQILARAIGYANTSESPSTATRSVTFTLNDGGKSGVGDPLSTTSVTDFIAVASVNDAPVGTPGSIALQVSTSYVLSQADFGFSDPTDSPANAFGGIRITSLPGAGTLEWNNGSGWGAVGVNQSISAADVAGGNLRYTAGGSTGSASFNFRVQDAGGTANGGVDTDTADRAMAVTITAGPPPVLGGITNLSYTENAGAVSLLPSLTVADTDSTDLTSATLQITGGYVNGQDLLAFVNAGGITGSFDPGSGTLTLTGLASKAQYQTALRSVTYENTSDAPGTTPRSVSIKLYDDGSPTPNVSSTGNATITVAALNDAPTLADTNVALSAALEDAAAPTGAAGTLVSSLVGGQADVDGGGALKGIAITSLDSANGTWYYTTDGGNTWNVVASAPSASASLLLASDANTRLYFKPTADYNGSASLTFRAWDRTSGTNGGIASTAVNGGTTAFSSATDTASIAVTSVNDAPVGADASLAMLVSTTHTFTASEFSFSDAQDSPADSFQAVQITSLPASGTLRYNGTAITGATLGSPFVVTVADINANLLTYDAGGSAATATFGFRVQDAGGTANGGADTDATERTFTLGVYSSFPPVLTGASTLTYTENSPATAINTGISLTDADSANIAGATIAIGAGFVQGEDFLSFADTANITGLYNASTGVLTLSGPDTVANYQAALRSVMYSNASDAPTAAARTVSFVVSDPSSNSSAPLTSTVTVAPQNDAPVLAAASPSLTSINEDQTSSSGQTVASFMGAIADADGALVPQGVAITGVTAVNGNWQYSLDGSTWTTFTASAGSSLLLRPQDYVRFVPNAENGGVSSFTFRAWDQTSGSAGGTASTSINGGTSAFSTQQNTASISVASVNDAPTLAAVDAASVAEVRVSSSTGDAGLSGTLAGSDVDVDSLTYGITGGTDNGDGTVSKSGAYGTLTVNKTSGAYSYAKNSAAIEALDDGEAAGDTFTVRVSDPSNAVATRTYTVNVSGADDQPTLGAVTAATVAENRLLATTTDSGLSGTLTASDIDVEALSYGIQGGTDNGDGTVSLAGAYGTLTLNKTTGAYSYAKNSAAIEALDDAEGGVDSFTFTVSDGDDALVTQGYSVTVSGANDLPVAIGDFGTATEAGGTANAIPGSPASGNVLLNDTDVDTSDTRIVSAVSGGAVGAAVSGAYGSLTLNADGSYSYVVNQANAAVQGLRTNAQTLVESFTYTLSDGTESATESLTITITGANDAPAATGTYTHTVPDTAATDAFAVPLTGTLAAGDVDAGDAMTWSGGGAGSFGTLTVNADGTYSYVINAAAVNALQAGQTLSDIFTATVADLGGLTDTRTITVNVVGANDAPLASGTYTHSVTDTAAADVFAAPFTGTLSASDSDAGDSITWSGGGAGAYGTLLVNANGSYAYAINAAGVNALHAGASPSDSFTVTVTDALGLTATRTVRIDITGANDTPGATGTYIHHVSDTAALDTFASLTGTLAATDRDAAETLTWTGGATGAYGTLTVNANGTYSYAVNAAAVNALQAGVSPTDSFTVTVTDALGSTDVRTIVITLVGADEVLTAPPTVDPLVTIEAGPTIAGTFDPNAVVLEVTIDGTTYRLGRDAGLSVSGNQWFLNLAVAGKSLASGVYEVTVHARDASGNGATDRSAIELVVALPQQEAPQQGSTGVTGATGTGGIGAGVIATSGSGVGAGGTLGSASAGSAAASSMAGADATTAPAALGGGAGGAGGTDSTAAFLNTLPAPAAGGAQPAQGGAAGSNSGQAEAQAQTAGVAVMRTTVSAGPSESAGGGAVHGPEAQLYVYRGIRGIRPDADGLYQVPADAFAHTSPGAVVQLEATLADGSPLPAWMGFDSRSGTFSGKPPGDAPADVEVKLTARDDAGREASFVFRPVFAAAASAPEQAPAPGQAPAGSSTTAIPGSSTTAIPSSLKALQDGIDAGGRLTGGGFQLARLSSGDGFGQVRASDEAVSQHALIAFREIPGKRLQLDDARVLRVPGDAFAHTDPTAVVVLEARLTDGRPLPQWLRFDPSTGIFSGKPPPGMRGDLEIEVTARDTDNREARISVLIALEELQAAAPGDDTTAESTVLGLSVDEQEAEKARAKARPDERPGPGADAGSTAGPRDSKLKPRSAAPFTEQLRAARMARDPLLDRITKVRGGS